MEFVGNNAKMANNIIRNFDAGITSYPSAYNQSIFDNTITNNSIGVQGLTVPALFYGNNIQNCSQYSVTLATSENVNATGNYWGTTDQSAIENSIYDHKNDQALGTVNFAAFLTQPNPQAEPLKNVANPPNENAKVLWAIATTIIITVILIMAAVFLSKQKKSAPL